MLDRQTRILQAAVRVIAQTGVRGLRMSRLAAEAEVSTALIYHHFRNRAGVLQRAFEYINSWAEHHTGSAWDYPNPRDQLEQLLLLEIQDTPEARDHNIVWGELRASAVFSGDLRGPLRANTRAWTRDVAGLVDSVRHTGLATRTPDSEEAAERLTAQVEGLIERWLSGSVSADRARALLVGAITTELGPRGADF
ncbi:TetR/AcrR family transcriptional regulator [Nocardia sp. NBC_01503]|uniref:TetR/AcrR family transcriptional regulator n=1 Tax=Nocardia sp. NBC_01503 TaxID=2975997 RepID=UPI002E7B3DC4|nr:TetR/AcrR family transcriptional regulator [Nocardia sp. NBC_01503]WTL32114.1 TetR/AcrR family transcriptional regulator [Nocardia sp. NBC_01503]